MPRINPLAVGAVVKLPLAEIDLSVLGEEEIEASVGKKAGDSPCASGSKREREKVEEASVTDILQDALMQKKRKKRNKNRKKRLRLLSGLPIKWRFRIISPK